MPDDSRTVVLLASDLMLTSSVSGAASASGLKFHNCSNAADAAEACSTAGDVLLLIDLGTPGLDVGELAEELSDELKSTAVAYGPHVHTTKLQAASEAGIGMVLSRGQFSSQFGRIVSAFADG